jgi:hypothetical protein
MAFKFTPYIIMNAIGKIAPINVIPPTMPPIRTKGRIIITALAPVKR